MGKLIVLDTNQLDGSSIGGPVFALLKALANASRNRLAIPSLVLDEHLTHYNSKVRELAQKRQDSDDQLGRLVPKQVGGMMLSSRYTNLNWYVDDATRRYEASLRDIFDVFDVDPESALEALRREAKRLPPASTNTSGKAYGGRDAAIWLSTLRYAAGQPGKVYFISGDVPAFHSHNLDADINRFGVSVALLRNVRELMGHLASDANSEVNSADIGRSEIVWQAIVGSLNQFAIETQLMGAVKSSRPTDGEMSFYSYWISTDGLKLLTTEDVRAYRVEGTTWTTLRAAWEVSTKINLKHSPRNSLATAPEENFQMSYRIGTTLLLRMNAKIEDAEVLGVTQPSQIELL